MKKSEEGCKEERRGLIAWVKRHRKQLIAAGIGVGTLILAILFMKNSKAIKAAWESVKAAGKTPSEGLPDGIGIILKEAEPVQKAGGGPAALSAADALPVDVRMHIRNLPEGYHASPEKIAEALQNNVILKDGQTWVSGYRKGVAAA